MPKPRKAISALHQKQLLQEANSLCPFCSESDVSTFEYHHIDGDPTHNDLGNLIVVCSSCHARITKQVLSAGEVLCKKAELARASHIYSATRRAGMHVSITSSSFRGDIAQHITKISGVKSPRIAHPPGSIGTNLAMKGYIDYLLRQYFEYRKADPSYGRRGPFSFAVIHRNIERKFGAKTFFLPERKFNELAVFLAEHIDDTIQGRRNRSGGRANYHSFEEHVLRHNL